MSVSQMIWLDSAFFHALVTQVLHCNQRKNVLQNYSLLKNNPKEPTADATSFTTAQTKPFRKVLAGSWLEAQHLENQKTHFGIGVFLEGGSVGVFVSGLGFFKAIKGQEATPLP